MTLEFIPVSSVRRELDDEIYKVLLVAEGEGWKLRRQGHKFHIYCPCGQNTVRVDGTPKNPVFSARRIKREIGHCPTQHGLDS